MKSTFCLCCVIFSLFAGQAAEFNLGKHGKLSLEVPGDWMVTAKSASRPDGTPVGCLVTIKPRGTANAKCVINFAYTTNSAPTPEVVRKAVLQVCERFVVDSVEKKENLSEFSLAQGYGAYCLFTDASKVGKQSKPGEYKVIGSGELQPGGEMMGVVSLFTDAKDSAELATMINIVNSLKVKAP